MTKAEIRRRILHQRAILSPLQRREYSIAIAEHLWAQPEYLQATVLHVYLPIGNEVDTQLIIERAWAENKSVVVPVVVPDDEHLHHVHYQKGDMLEPGPYGIPQPIGSQEMTLAELEPHALIVLVPVVAFNRHMYRIGYGKGYYDRFLATIPHRRFGLAYSFQYAEFEPEPQDVPLDAVITECGVVR